MNEGGSDLSAAFCFGRREFPDGFDKGNDESKASICERNSENPRQGGGTHSGPGNGLGNGARELDQVQCLFLNPWQLLIHFHFHFLLFRRSWFVVVVGIPNVVWVWRRRRRQTSWGWRKQQQWLLSWSHNSREWQMCAVRWVKRDYRKLSRRREKLRSKRTRRRRSRSHYCLCCLFPKAQSSILFLPSAIRLLPLFCPVRLPFFIVLINYLFGDFITLILLLYSGFYTFKL